MLRNYTQLYTPVGAALTECLENRMDFKVCGERGANMEGDKPRQTFA